MIAAMVQGSIFKELYSPALTGLFEPDALDFMGSFHGGTSYSFCAILHKFESVFSSRGIIFDLSTHVEHDSSVFPPMLCHTQ